MSADKYYSLSWDSYQAGICRGFAEQQSKQEFVDMTLVAEGHLVKVHKNLICLASSFIKDMIKAAPCEHPIMFLNNVSHEILCYLLEYIYMGEVKVAEDKLQSVLRVASELKLCGLEQLSKKKPQVGEAQQNSVISTNDNCVVRTPTRAMPMQRSVNCMVPNENICQYTNGNEPEQMSLDCYNQSPPLNTISPVLAPENGIYTTYSGEFQTAPIEIPATTEAPSTLPVTNITIDNTGSLLQHYSVSQRGCLQLLLNRFVYNLHHQAQCGRRRRWRCADYRRARCAAYVDTLGETITLRKNVHHHEYHDDIILSKVRENRVFGSLAAADRAPGRPRPLARASAGRGAGERGAASGDES